MRKLKLKNIKEKIEREAECESIDAGDIGFVNLQKQKRWRSSEYTKAAKDQPCTMNSPWCTYKDEETCFRHLNESWAGKGKGLKADDFAGFDGCQGCEDWYTDKYVLNDETKSIADWYAFRAMYRTLRNRIDRGILKV